MAENEDQLEKYGKPDEMRDIEKSHIHLLTIIGEVEGHECLAANSKSTKYEHVIPILAAVEENPEIHGLLVLINTVGGDVESGLAIAEMIASISKPTVSLVLGGSHSIGVPLAVSTDYSFIVPTGTMMIHPVRMTGMIIGVAQTFDYFQKIQDRISGFVVEHSRIEKERLMELMLETGELTKDVGSVLVGEQAVAEGIIDAVGGISDAFQKLRKLMGE
ncbi:MAG: ATP-dependent Clp protease proteolytic subunit [Lachnospiraceae bacterium]|nr:ATP-dependent Clp protease proteolytic subunit [Lachnospiraceae bacterium]